MVSTELKAYRYLFPITSSVSDLRTSAFLKREDFLGLMVCFKRINNELVLGADLVLLGSGLVLGTDLVEREVFLGTNVCFKRRQPTIANAQ